MVNDEWSGAEALENAFRVADEELRKVERERDQARRERDKWEEKYLDTDESLHKARDERDQYKRSGDEWKECHADAVRERDGAVQARNTALVLVSQAQDERDEALDRAEAAEARTTPAVSRADVAEVLGRCLNPEMWNVTFPIVVNEVCDLFGIEAGQAEDPVEEKARELWDVVHADDGVEWEEAVSHVHERYFRLARHVLGQEAKR